MATAAIAARPIFSLAAQRPDRSIPMFITHLLCVATVLRFDFRADERRPPGNAQAYARPLALLLVWMVAILVVVIVVVITISVAVVIARELLAEALRRGIFGIARQNVARGGLRNQAIGVLLEQEPLADRVLGGSSHYAVVPLLASVALFDRGARIAGGHSVRLGHGERNVASGQIAFVSFQRPARHRVPARVRSERSLQEHGFHARDL